MKKMTCLIAALCAMGGCGFAESHERGCTSELRSSPAGRIHDEQGKPVTPTRVVREDAAGLPTAECVIGDGVYSCWEGTGGPDVVISVHVGGREWKQTVNIPSDECHEERVTLDFVLDGLPSCEPAIAVEGELIGPDGTDLPAARVTLTRVPKGSAPSDVHVECDVDEKRYRCPAPSPYDAGEYDLEVSAGGVSSLTRLQIDAKDCQVETRRYDFDFSG